MPYHLVINTQAIIDLQEAIDFYNQQKEGLGKKFERAINQSVKILCRNPHFQVRYDSVRCYPLRNFPYMIHFQIDEASKIIYIEAVLHTSLHHRRL